ncbi:hypothetical protein MMC25_005829 [Agyrium rufum]|nr:hypothetical protein [Agyrium rufum]
MPSFLKDLRRRSKASFKTEKSSSNGSEGSNGTGPATNKSSSTLDSIYGNVSTPASSILPQISTSNLASTKTNGAETASLPSRPSTLTAANNRYSMSGLGAPQINGSSMSKLPQSIYAPQILSISDNSWVNQKVLLVYGQIGEAAVKALDGTLSISHPSDNFPTTHWPVVDSHFKALIHLSPGWNRLRLDVSSPKLTSNSSSIPAHTSFFNLMYLPITNSPPLQLAILLASDSPATFDAVPERVQREGNDLDTAIRKFRMMAHMWQALTAEQMFRNGFGRRAFRFEEEWQTGSLSLRDREQGQMRNETKIHVVPMKRTLTEIRDLDRAQQYGPGKSKNDLHGFAVEALKEYFRPTLGQTQYVAALLLDTHWNTNSKVITGHAALGGADGPIHVGIFGSHALQSYPSAIEEIVPALTDCTRTDTAYVANDGDKCGSNWEAASTAMGAHLHEVGHVFGCPHEENGIMAADFNYFNRTFIIREAYSTRDKQQGLRLCLPMHDVGFHRLDVLRLRNHPCFRTPLDPPSKTEEGVQVWAIDNGRILVTALSGISFIELYPEGEGACHSWIDYYGSGGDSSMLQRQILLNESDLRARLPEKSKMKSLRLEIHSAGLGRHVVQDISLLTSKKAHVKMPKGQTGFRGSRLGQSQMEGSTPEELILQSAIDQTKLLLKIKVYHGFAIDGLEFFYEDTSTQLFGKRGGQPGGSEFFFDTRKGEILLGFYVRAGLWIDGIEILTNLGRRSGVYGNPTGGQG